MERIISMICISLLMAKNIFGHRLNESWPHHERDLAEYLLRGYNKDVRPVKVQNESVLVTLGVALTQLISLDEKNQILSTNCWLNQMWIDPKLQWNPQRFDNLTSILLPVKDIWKPDILLYNTAEAGYYHKLIETNVIIHNTGNVTWLVSSIFRSSCALNMKDFPFDRQTCFLKFASWTYDNLKVDLTLTTSQGDISAYVESREWELINVTAHRNLVPYFGYAAPLAEITISLVMRRYPLYYVFTYLVPCIGCTGFVFLGFILPGECGEKVFLDIKVLLSLILFFFTVGEVMPPTAIHIPLISLYYVTSMLFVSLTTAFQVWTLNLHHRGSRNQQVPRIFRISLPNLVASLLQKFQTPKTDPIRATGQADKRSLPNNLNGSSPVDLVRDDIDRNNFQQYFQEEPSPPAAVHLPKSPQLHRGKNGYRRQLDSGPVFMPQYCKELDVFERRLSTILNSICDMIEKSEKRLTVDEEMEKLNEEWQNVAVSMDRTLLSVFLILVSGVFVMLFVSVTGEN